MPNLYFTKVLIYQFVCELFIFMMKVFLYVKIKTITVVSVKLIYKLNVLKSLSKDNSQNKFFDGTDHTCHFSFYVDNK